MTNSLFPTFHLYSPEYIVMVKFIKICYSNNIIMSKAFSITVSDWVYNDIVEKRPKRLGRSEWVEQLLVKAQAQMNIEKGKVKGL